MRSCQELSSCRYLTDNYATDNRVRQILDNTDICLVPSLNPDGFEMESRYNVNEEDLNRAFPGIEADIEACLLLMKLIKYSFED